MSALYLEILEESIPHIRSSCFRYFLIQFCTYEAKKKVREREAIDNTHGRAQVSSVRSPERFFILQSIGKSSCDK